MQYGIEFNLDRAMLHSIYEAGQYVTLVKHIESSLPEVGPVVWVSFLPFERNAISWSGDYAVYVSESPLQTGRRVDVLVSIPSQPGLTYTLQGETLEAVADGPADRYAAANAERGGLLFGLAQQAFVNAVGVSAPTNVVPLFVGETTWFRPAEEVSLFLSPYSQSGVLLEAVPPKALRITLSPDAPLAWVELDPGTGAFRTAQ